MHTQSQSDTRLRVVSLTNLRAMCDRVSGFAHTYAVSKVSRSRVHVEYSNPDEYGYPSPMTCVFPCIPGYTTEDGKDNPRVILDVLYILHDNWQGEGYQRFEPVLRCPTLWRDPVTGTWETRKDVQKRLGLPPEKFTTWRYVELFPDGSVKDCFPESEA